VCLSVFLLGCFFGSLCRLSLSFGGGYLWSEGYHGVCCWRGYHHLDRRLPQTSVTGDVLVAGALSNLLQILSQKFQGTTLAQTAIP